MGLGVRGPEGVILPGQAELPGGTVTFLLTDIQGSTRLWESVPDAMAAALEQHNRLLTVVIEGHDGVVVTSRRPTRCSTRRPWPARGNRPSGCCQMPPCCTRQVTMIERLRARDQLWIRPEGSGGLCESSLR